MSDQIMSTSQHYTGTAWNNTPESYRERMLMEDVARKLREMLNHPKRRDIRDSDTVTIRIEFEIRGEKEVEG